MVLARTRVSGARGHRLRKASGSSRRSSRSHPTHRHLNPVSIERTHHERIICLRQRPRPSRAHTLRGDRYRSVCGAGWLRITDHRKHCGDGRWCCARVGACGFPSRQDTSDTVRARRYRRRRSRHARRSRALSRLSGVFCRHREPPATARHTAVAVLGTRASRGQGATAGTRTA